MTRENFDALCRACCSRKSISECLFADAEEGFIDTSAEGDGSRGIAFSRRKMMVNFDGTIKIVAYKKIRSVHIISSLEGAFADELEISGEHSRLRITDFSLDKHILKQIIEGLCEGIEEPVHEEIPVEEQPEIAENVSVYEDKTEVCEENACENIENGEVVLGETREKSTENDDIIHDYEDKIEWLSDSANTDIHDEKIEWLSSMTDEETAPVIPETTVDGESEMREIIGQMSHEETLGFLSKTLGEINGAEPFHEDNSLRGNAPETVPPSDGESEMREIIGQMSREETLGFLSKTLGEINGAEPIHEENLLRGSDSEPFFPTTQTAVIPERPIAAKIAAQNPPAPKSPTEKPAAHEIPRDNGELSKEPVWGDIYIKASKSLRELCENGRLSMDIIENELRERLLDSARAFADIVKDEQKIPKVLIPKIAELKNAADHFDEYFSHGEDVGVRVMFFMLYQMLSYSDRIAENPETKERLNDFFRRFGTAGITLSMLDVRG